MSASMMMGGLAVVVSPLLPVPPSPAEEARRIVRHGLADVLEWLGEDVGPEPDEPTHAYRAGNTLIASREFVDTVMVSDVARIAGRVLGGAA